MIADDVEVTEAHDSDALETSARTRARLECIRPDTTPTQKPPSSRTQIPASRNAIRYTKSGWHRYYRELSDRRV